jgi:hypothetical protein
VPGRCYYTQEQGSWDDLAAIGVGDPRPAIPAGLEEQYSEFWVFVAPPADCNATALDNPGSFSASWAEADGGAPYVSASAYPVAPGSKPGYGYLDAGSAYWSNGSFQFNVSAYGDNGPLGRDTIEAIARAMDPDFSSACFIASRELDPAELEGLGFHAPATPDGYEVTNTYLNVTEAPGGDCGESPDAEYYPQYNLHWMMEGDGTVIEANASRYPQNTASQGYIHENGLNWTDANGTSYSVYGYSRDGNTGFDIDTLIAVAQSMDPSLDPSTLEEGPIGIPEKPVR